MHGDLSPDLREHSDLIGIFHAGFHGIYRKISISVCLKVGYPPKGVSCFFLFSDRHLDGLPHFQAQFCITVRIAVFLYNVF